MNRLEQSSSGPFSSSELDHSDFIKMEDVEDNEEEEGDTSTESLPLEVEIEIKDSVSTSIYICEVCQKDKRDYNTLGDHRKHVHKLPWRQERLGPYVSVLSNNINNHSYLFLGRNLLL